MCPGLWGQLGPLLINETPFALLFPYALDSWPILCSSNLYSLLDLIYIIYTQTQHMWEIFMRIYLLLYYDEGQHSGADFMIYPNHSHTWDILNYIRFIEFSLMRMDWTVRSRVKFFL